MNNLQLIAAAVGKTNELFIFTKEPSSLKTS